MISWCRLAPLAVLVGILLLPLRAVAATIPKGVRQLDRGLLGRRKLGFVHAGWALGETRWLHSTISLRATTSGQNGLEL